MHKNVPAWIGAAVVAAALSVCMPAGSAQNPGAATDKDKVKVITGEIQIPEISGMAFLPGDRLLVVADDPFPAEKGHSVFLLKNASQRLLTGKVMATEFEPIKIDADPKDLEDVAWDRGSNIFLVTSHSRNKDGEVKPKRSAIIRLPLESFKPESLPALQFPAEFDESRKQKPADAGFNVEGAAWSPAGHLLLGLRSPTEATKEAILLEIENPGSDPLKPKVAAHLQLNGNGIRGMFYDADAKGLWLLAGVSPDLPDGVVKEWALWFRQDDGTLKPITLPKEALTLDNAEAVTRVSVGTTSAPHLLVVEDGPKVSRYVLFPVPRP